MHTAVVELTASLIEDIKASGADKLLLGNLPAGTTPEVYSGPVETETGHAKFQAIHNAKCAQLDLALSQAGIDDSIVTSSLPDGIYPVWCHIPSQDGWFQVDGFPCGLLPHVVLELQDMAKRGESIQTLHVTNELAHLVTLKD
jgi:hypothetical protein